MGTYRPTTRHNLEDALADALARVEMGVSLVAACEDVALAYGWEPVDLQEFAEERAVAEGAIAQWDGGL